MTNEFKLYKRVGECEARLYVKGENLSNISVSRQDNPEEDMGWICRNPKDHKDMRYVNYEYFINNYQDSEVVK